MTSRRLLFARATGFAVALGVTSLAAAGVAWGCSSSPGSYVPVATAPTHSGAPVGAGSLGYARLGSSTRAPACSAVTDPAVAQMVAAYRALLSSYGVVLPAPCATVAPSAATPPPAAPSVSTPGLG